MLPSTHCIASQAMLPSAAREESMSRVSRTEFVAKASGSRLFSPGWVPYEATFTRTEIKDSTGHNLRRLGVGDIGGAFSLRRVGYTNVIVTNVSYNDTVGGVCCVSDNGGLFLKEPTQPATGVLKTTGTKLSASASPTKSNVDGKVFAVELLRDGAPKAIGASLKEKTSLARKSGNEYLNYQFGWVPFVSDIRKMVNTARQASKLAEQYRHDANRPIRRRLALPPEEFTRILNVTLNPFPVTSSSAGRGVRTESTTKKTWFVGKFRYYLPIGDDVISRFRRYDRYAEKLFGIGVTPSPDQMWAAMPWSWIIDWFTDLGSVVQNISDFGTDGLVMEYGYVMCHTRYDRNLRGFRTDKTPQASVGYDYVSETKVRLPAHPYGFGLTDASLTKKQLAILGALGLTQGHRGD